MSRRFADLSEANDVFDASAYRSAGRRLVALKASEGADRPDGRYGERLKRARTAGLRVLHYHFLRPDLHKYPHDEIMFFVSTLHGRLMDTDFVFLDLEVRGSRDWWEVAHYGRQAWQQLAHLTGHKPGMYSYSSFFFSLGAAAHIKGCRYWVADYGPHPQTPSWLGRPWAWQYTDGRAGPMPHECQGIGRCDMSLLNRRTARWIKLRPPR